MKPNIFSIATSELSQDGFITWLLQWADPSAREFDTQLNTCAQDFLRQLMGKDYTASSYEIKKVNAGRQWENIDVWAEVNDEYLIIIEDKTFTGEHSNQLIVYRQIAEEYCIKKDFKPPICVYLKTGSEPLSSLEKIESKGFKIFGRADFMVLLNKYQSMGNEIFNDFKSHLETIESAYNSYEITKIKEWSNEAWIGFYQYLEKSMKLISWGNVNNPAGGFWMALFNWDYWSDYVVYVQIEQGKLCFKICTDPDEIDIAEESMDRGSIRGQWHNVVMEKATAMNLPHVRRPDRFGYGKYMTVAVVDRANWLGQDDSILDKEKVVATLKTYLELHTSCTKIE
jgi:hypothetical protein